MKKIIFPAALLTLTALAACGTPRNHYAPDTTGTIAHFRYACEDGTIIPVRFEGHVAIARLSDGTEIILDQQPTDHGFTYANPHYQLRGVGRNAEWTVGRRMPIHCRG